MPDYNFWNERWLNNQIGFHQNMPHPSLVKYADLFKGHQKVFVPLCGKSLDMIFLRNAGLEVIGVEFSEMAIHDFIKENKLKLEKTTKGPFNLFSGEGFKIYQGDFFNLKKEDFSGITACYDRASMVAFNYGERVEYARHLIEMASDLKVILSPLLDYGKVPESAPPFSVTEDEIKELYGKFFECKMLDTKDISIRENLKERGAVYEREVTWQLTRKH